MDVFINQSIHLGIALSPLYQLIPVYLDPSLSSKFFLQLSWQGLLSRPTSLTHNPDWPSLNLLPLDLLSRRWGWESQNQGSGTA